MVHLARTRSGAAVRDAETLADYAGFVPGPVRLLTTCRERWLGYQARGRRCAACTRPLDNEYAGTSGTSRHETSPHW